MRYSRCLRRASPTVAVSTAVRAGIHVANAAAPQRRGSGEATPFDYDAWRTLRTIPEIAMLSYGSSIITGGNDPERVKGARITASLMPTLGIVPAIGRGFVDAEDGDEVPRVAILGDGLWRRQFATDPSIVGRQVEIDGASWTIVGIMPRGAILPG